MDSARPRLALTSGEPAGIGPDICLQAALALRDAQSPTVELVCLADESLLAQRAAAARPAVSRRRTRISASNTCRWQRRSLPAGWIRATHATCWHCWIRRWRAVATGEFAAMVTAPVQKSVINDAGIAFTGHTEYLAAACGAPRPVMMLVAGALRVALATTHLPLREVSAAITAQSLDEILDIVQRDLRRALRACRSPRIAVCGLNPHAGEGGHLGREEIDVIAPAIERARDARHRRQRSLAGRHPVHAAPAASTATWCWPCITTRACRCSSTPVSALRSTSRSACRIIRTSVDHGTALDLAGTGRADAGSLLAAMRARRRTRRAPRDPRPQTLRPAFPARSGGAAAHRRRGQPAPGRAPGRDRPRPGRAHGRAAGPRRPARRRGDRSRPGRRPARTLAAARCRLHEADALDFDFARLAARTRRQAARGGQPALQHLHAAAVPLRSRSARPSAICT